MGFCAGYPTPGFMNPGAGYGYARGMGRGMGLRRGGGGRRFWDYGRTSPDFYPPIPGFRNPNDPWGAAEITPEQEQDILKSEARMLKDEIARIEKRINELEGEKK
jgi:hypothetical protein